MVDAMSKQKNTKVNVRLKHIRDTNQWYFKDIHQKTINNKDMIRLQNGETLRLVTLHAPDHTAKTLEKKSSRS